MKYRTPIGERIEYFFIHLLFSPKESGVMYTKRWKIIQFIKFLRKFKHWFGDKYILVGSISVIRTSIRIAYNQGYDDALEKKPKRRYVDYCHFRGWEIYD